MVKSLSLFAIMAGLAIAAPMADILEIRTYPTKSVSVSALPAATSTPSKTGLIPTIPFIKLGSVNLPLITLSTGFTSNVALALGAAFKGVQAGVVSVEAKAALAIYIVGAGKAYFPATTCSAIGAWAKGGAAVTLSTVDIAAIEVSLLGQSVISAAGGVLAFLNGVVTADLGGATTCACSTIDTLHLSGLSGFLATNANLLSVEVLGALKLASAGGLAVTLTPAAHDALSVYLLSPTATMSVELKLLVEAWLAVGGVVSGSAVDVKVGGVGTGVAVTIGTGIAHSVTVGPTVILTTPLITSLGAFIDSALFLDLDLTIQAALKSCHSGGVAAALSGSIRTALSIFLASPKATLSVELKAAITAWLAGVAATGVEVAPVVTLPFVTVGNTILGNLDVTGALIPSVQTTLLHFCSSPSGLALDVTLLATLKSIAAGTLAVKLTTVEIELLAAYLHSAGAALSVELKATLLLFLSCGITGAPSVDIGVGIGAGKGFVLPAASISLVTVALDGAIGLTATLKSAIHVALSGVAANVLSTVGKAELTAFLLAGEVVTGLNVEVTGLLTSWVSGVDGGCTCSS